MKAHEVVSADREAIEQVGKEYFAATNAGAPERCIATVAADVIIMPPGRPSITGKEQLRSLSNDYHTRYELSYKLVYDEIDVRGDVAFVRTTVAGKRKSKADGSIEDVIWRNLWILKRQDDGQWKFWRIMFNSPLLTR
jgi:ketosteroid isomerase-like protein